MKQHLVPSAPQAGICINKSRVKLYHKDTTPTYYLSDGQEFSIELYNPLQDTVMAKITLNGKELSQGGLVLRPGERIFLERYFDIARKFKFETYEVSNTQSNLNAIQHNGGLRVQFYREQKPAYYDPIHTMRFPDYIYSPWNNPLHYNYCNGGNAGITSFTSSSNSSIPIGSALNHTSTSSLNANASAQSSAYYSSISGSLSEPQSKLTTAGLRSAPSSKVSLDSLSTIETGRVEAGSSSDQSFQYVSKNFESWAFHTVEYKLLPVSQRVNTVDDIQVKRYCTNCGGKQKAEWKFCPNCSEKL